MKTFVSSNERFLRGVLKCAINYLSLLYCLVQMNVRLDFIYLTFYYINIICDTYNIMRYSTITSKGQVTIPADVRSKLQLNPGSQLEFIVQDNYLLAIPINKSVIQLEGILPRPEKSLSCEEIDEIIRG